MDEYGNLLTSFEELITSHSLSRKAAYPTSSSNQTDGNPRTSKFGGKYPLLPNESVPKCLSCDQPLMMVIQLYLPSLPEFVRSQAPSQIQDSLIVLSVCPECLGSSGYRIDAHPSDVLDTLVYHEDVGPKWSEPEFQYRRRFVRFPNSPQPFDAVDQRRRKMELRVIGGWTETEMVPHLTNSELKEALEKAKMPVSSRISLAVHDINIRAGVAGNCYVGGWARFCGDDQTPGENWSLLCNLCESDMATLEWGDCGAAQVWIGVGENAGQFKFTCSTH
jgi:hypothetical protein